LRRRQVGGGLAGEFVLGKRMQRHRTAAGQYQRRGEQHNAI